MHRAAVSPLDVYAAVRTSPTRFLVAPGHEDPSLESIVERHDGFFVVDKFGTAGRVAAQHDGDGG